jgi:hypothetical protein
MAVRLAAMSLFFYAKYKKTGPGYPRAPLASSQTRDLSLCILFSDVCYRASSRD